MKKILVIGYGSIGQRHAKNFKNLGCEVAVLSRRHLETDYLTYNDLKNALTHFGPQIILVCNETYLHQQSLSQIADSGFDGLVVVEKPIFDLNFDQTDKYSHLNIRVSYNLRFHPLLSFLKTELDGQKILSAQSYVGQYLPSWRPQADYRESYSAKSDQGGGVLLDLSHELDFCSWLFGKPVSVVGKSAKLSSLEINSTDTAVFLVQYANCPIASLQLNYIDRITQRNLTVVTDENTYALDFIKKTLVKNNKNISIESAYDSYQLMSKNILDSQGELLTDYEEALNVLRLIKALNTSTKSNQWVQL